jgi:hypothetical protein
MMVQNWLYARARVVYTNFGTILAIDGMTAVAEGGLIATRD